MKAPLFTGSSAAIVTPMRDDGSVNLDILPQLLEMQIRGGTAAITVCGTTGESATLKDVEKLALISSCVSAVNGRIPVIAGTGSNDTEHAVFLGREAEKAGADGLLLVTPYYTELPVIVYNVPSRTGVSMNENIYRQLSEHPNINGVKEASGDTELVLRTRAACGDDFYIWSGNDAQIVPLMALGGQGVISVLANLCPEVPARITAACQRGDYPSAAELQTRYMPLIDAMFCEVNPIPVKTAMHLMGLDVGPLRMPLCEMEDASRNRLTAVLTDCGLLS